MECQGLLKLTPGEFTGGDQRRAAGRKLKDQNRQYCRSFLCKHSLQNKHSLQSKEQQQNHEWLPEEALLDNLTTSFDARPLAYRQGMTCIYSQLGSRSAGQATGSAANASRASLRSDCRSVFVFCCCPWDRTCPFRTVNRLRRLRAQDFRPALLPRLFPPEIPVLLPLRG